MNFNLYLNVQLYNNYGNNFYLNIVEPFIKTAQIHSRKYDMNFPITYTELCCATLNLRFFQHGEASHYVMTVDHVLSWSVSLLEPSRCNKYNWKLEMDFILKIGQT